MKDVCITCVTAIKCFENLDRAVDHILVATELTIRSDFYLMQES